MHPMLNTAVKAARRAGTVINRASQNLDVLTVRSKSPNDFVSEVDRDAEAAIIDVIRKAYPDHAILAEESGSSGQGEYEWVIDPLDGTTNFLHGMPHYAVSIALRQRGVLMHGVIYDPVRNELFTASRGAGAFLNDRRIRVSRRTQMADSLIGTGFPFRELSDVDGYLGMLKAVMPKCAGIRRAGAASLDLAYVAAGRFDAFWEFGLAPWDIAAGALMVAESGGLIGDASGEAGYMDSGAVVAGTPKVFAQLLGTLAPHLPARYRPVRTKEAMPASPPAEG
ncbi:MAG: inositol monophosphatase [Burkholderiales bacterium]|nr:inositol monophosphatase [Burkholderiales bacterium]